MKAEIFNKSKGSWNGDEIRAEIIRENKFFSQFDGQRVKIKYHQQADFMSGGGEVIGKIKKLQGEKEHYGFFKGKATRSYRTVTLGMFDGWYATITIEEIEKI